MGQKSETVSSVQDDLDEIRERLETLVSDISDMANKLQGAFGNNDRITAVAGEMHFTAGEISGDFGGAAHGWRSELSDVLEALIAAGE